MPSPSFSKLFALVLSSVGYVCGFEQKVMCGFSFGHALFEMFVVCTFLLDPVRRMPAQFTQAASYGLSKREHNLRI